MFALLVLSVILVGGVVETAPAVVQQVQGQAWVIDSATPSPAPSDTTPAFTVGVVDTTVTLDKLIAVFQGMAGGDRAVTIIREGQAAAARGGKATYPNMVLTPKYPVKYVAPIQGSIWLYNLDLLTTPLNLQTMWAFDVAFFLEAGPFWNIPGFGMTPPDPQPRERGASLESR
jgi:hypothetical protein